MNTKAKQLFRKSKELNKIKKLMVKNPFKLNRKNQRQSQNVVKAG